MSKIPVLATIRTAYAFTFGHLGAIIGAIWLPMVVVTVAGFFTLHSFLGAAIDMVGGSNPGALGPALLMMLGYMLAALLLYAVMYTAVVQLAAGTRPGGPVVVVFAFGPMERRMFRALLALVGLFFLLASAAMLTAMVASLAAGAAGAHLSAFQSSALLSASVYAILAVAVPRFFLLLPAIVTGEDAPALRRAWELSAGHFLALFAIAVAVLAPGYFIMWLASLLLPGAGPVAGGSETAQAVALLQQQRAMMPGLMGIQFLISPLTLGPIAGASVAAWQALTGAGAKAESFS